MKHLLWVSVLVFFCSFVGIAQCEFRPLGIPEGAWSHRSSAVNEEVLWITIWTEEYHNCICRTSDGGNTWHHDSVDVAPGGSRITGISAIDASTAWVSMTDPSGSTTGGIFKTTDGGSTWQHQSSAFPGSGGFVNDVHFFDANNGLCMGDPNDGYFEIYTTTNGGEHWSRVPSQMIPAPDVAEVGTPNRTAYQGDSYWFGTYAPGYSGGRVFRTTDRGLTWSAGTRDTRLTNPAIAFQDEGTGIASSYYGTLWRTTDGGLTWSALPSPEWLLPGYRYPVFVPGTVSTYALPCVGLIGRDTVSIMAFSTDAGLSWKRLDVLPIPWAYQYYYDNIVGVAGAYLTPSFASVGCGWIAAEGGVIHWPGYTGKHIWRCTPSVRYLSWDEGFASAPSSVSIGNYGTESLNVTGFELPQGHFTLIDPPATPFTLAPWEAVDVEITFSPQAGGSFTDSLVILSDAPNAPALGVTLSGTTMRQAYVDVGANMFAVGERLYEVAPSGIASEVCRISAGRIDGLSVNPAERALYGIQARSSGSTLYRIDPQFPGVLSSVTIPVADLRAIAFSTDGRLFGGTAQGALLRINPATGDTALIGSASGMVYASLAFSPSGELYASVQPPLFNKDGIYIVDTTDGSTAMLGKTGDNAVTPSIAFTRDGELFGLKGTGSQDNTVIRIDPSSGVGTEVGPTGTSGLQAIAMIDLIATSVPEALSDEIPAAFELHQNYPNPFNPSTTIQYAIPSACFVTLKVYNVLGEEVATLLTGTHTPGMFQASWEASRSPSGVYFYRLRADDFVDTKRMILVK